MPVGTPKCPNHGCGMNPTDDLRIWICPISDARFEADCTPQGICTVQHKDGTITEERRMLQISGQGKG